MVSSRLMGMMLRAWRNSCDVPSDPSPDGRGQEPLRQMLRRGDEMEIAVGRVVRADRSVGRRQIGNLAAADLDLLFRDAAGRDPFLPLLGQAGREGEVAAGLEEDAVGGPFAEEHVGADDGHVGNDRRAEHPRHHRLLQHELLFHAAAQAAVQAAQGDQVLHVAAPFGQRVLQPEEVGVAAEAGVKALGRHAHGHRLDLWDSRPRLSWAILHSRGRLCYLRRRQRLGQRLVGRLVQIVQPQDAVLHHRHAERFGARVQPQLVAQFGVGRLGLLLLRQAEVQPPGKRGHQVGIHHGREVGLRLEQAGRLGVLLPPQLQQAPVRGGVVDAGRRRVESTRAPQAIVPAARRRGRGSRGWSAAAGRESPAKCRPPPRAPVRRRSAAFRLRGFPSSFCRARDCRASDTARGRASRPVRSLRCPAARAACPGVARR